MGIRADPDPEHWGCYLVLRFFVPFTGRCETTGRGPSPRAVLYPLPYSGLQAMQRRLFLVFHPSVVDPDLVGSGTFLARSGPNMETVC